MDLDKISFLKNLKFLEFLFETDNILIGKIKETNIYFRIIKLIYPEKKDLEYLSLSWYNIACEPRGLSDAQSKVTFDVVLDAIGLDIPDDIIYNLDFFSGKKIIISKE